MTFEIAERGLKSKIIDLDREVSLEKMSSYGPDVSNYIMVIEGKIFKISLLIDYGNEIRNWKIKTINYPTNFDGDKKNIKNLALENLIAFRDIFYIGNPTTISVSLDLS